MPHLSSSVMSVKNGFASLGLAVVLGFLFIVAFSVLFLANPIERAREKHDARLRGDAQNVLEAIGKFYVSRGRVPWADQINTQKLSPALDWKTLSDPSVGICADLGCNSPGQLVSGGFLNESMLQRDSVHGRYGAVYLGKANGTNSPIYACFIPEAGSTRLKTGELYKIKLGAEFPKNGTLPSCPGSITWQEEDVCYFCVQK